MASWMGGALGQTLAGTSLEERDEQCVSESLQDGERRGDATRPGPGVVLLDIDDEQSAAWPTYPSAYAGGRPTLFQPLTRTLLCDGFVREEVDDYDGDDRYGIR
jgi:hypothetical protein